MPGSKIGGKKSAQKNLERDPDFYRKIGKIGGASSNRGGFYGRPDLARIAGALGGRKSSRAGIKNGESKKPSKHV